ncbi:uncharacterized protein LOC132735540 [Ruditapes philippinarum]|uniref:uncharacterized protein LOC132735540 n=1 Tax=Ruditapes philippinarum TaxID=129788 RepID=UPI00295B9757|nr:uncharacterized protein LOC132735540 [Ruditapes philippinarum]
MFIILAFLCIVLIICVISVLPVILVSFKMGNSPDTNDKSSGTLSTMAMEEAFKNFMFRELRSQIAKGIIRKHIFCDKCQAKGRNSYDRKGFGDPDELECCQENVFDDFTTFKDTFTEKLQSYFKDIQDLGNRIFKLEDEVIRLQHNGNKSEGNITSTSPPDIFGRTILQNRVALNNNLLNQLLSQKRSSMQLKGTAKSNAIEWQEDITNGDIFSTNNNGLHVQSGGTYYLYTNIQFKKNNCTDGEVFEYRIFKNRDGYKRIIAHVKQTCIGFPNSFAISLNFQKVVDVRQGESFSMTVSSHSLSLDPWTHVFGLIEI